jgi:hypothetical protein
MNNMSKEIRKALEDARHELVTLNGLTAFDGPAPGETFTIDTRDAIDAIDQAIQSAGSNNLPS